jgi:hypothetical protein
MLAEVDKPCSDPEAPPLARSGYTDNFDLALLTNRKVRVASPRATLLLDLTLLSTPPEMLRVGIQAADSLIMALREFSSAEPVARVVHFYEMGRTHTLRSGARRLCRECGLESLPTALLQAELYVLREWR